MPDGVETISDYLFYKKTTITSVTLPASLKKIGTAAFQGCTKLTSITLPDGFTTLGEHAFDGCSGLKTVTFGQSLTRLRLQQLLRPDGCGPARHCGDRGRLRLPRLRQGHDPVPEGGPDLHRLQRLLRLEGSEGHRHSPVRHLPGRLRVL